MTKQTMQCISSPHSDILMVTPLLVGNHDAFAHENSGGYYTVRPNSHVDYLISGQVILGRLADLIESAQSSIDLLVWGFDPSLRLKRDGTSDDSRYRLGTLLAKKALEGVKVRVRCYEFISTLIRAGNITGAPGAFWESFRRKKDIITELNSIRSSATYIHIWHKAQVKNKLNIDYLEINDPDTFNSPFFKELKTYHKEQNERQRQAYQQYLSDYYTPAGQPHTSPPQNFYEWSKNHRVDSRHAIFPENYFMSESVLEYFSTPHQKMALIDFEAPPSAAHEPSALVMGNNLRHVDWDRPEHLYEDPERDAGPCQDIACHVKGPILNDINHNFEQVYNKHTRRPSKPPLPALKRPLLPLAVTNKAEYRHTLQLCRTYVEAKETAIHHLYTNVIAHLDDYLYIENQYFRHDKLAATLVKRMKYLRTHGSDKTPHIFLVIHPAGSMYRGTTEETLAKLAKGPAWEEAKKNMAPGDVAELEALGMRISLCMLMTCGLKESFRSKGVSGPKSWDYKLIYVHSKAMISDDVFFTIGSANLNYRSMMTDNELNIACHNETLPEQFRHEIMAKHMGAGYSDQLTIKGLFKEWEGVRKKNDEIVEDKKGAFQGGSFLVSYGDNGWLDWRLD